MSAIAVLVVIGFAFIFAQNKAGLAAKLASGSGQVRLMAAQEALQAFKDSPIWGIGYGNPDVDTILFIGSMAQIGSIGLFLLLMILVAPVWELIRRRHPVLVFLVPLVLTTTLAQPLFDKSLFYFIVGLVVTYPYEMLGRYNFVVPDYREFADKAVAHVYVSRERLHIA